MAHIYSDGVYKRAYSFFIDKLIFLKVRYNKVVDRINRYEEMLLECLKLFKLGGLTLVYSKPVAG